MMKEIVTSANEKGVTLYINDNKITEAEYQAYFSDRLQLMIPIAAFTDKLDCLVNVYENETVTLAKGDSLVKVYGDSDVVNINGNAIQAIDKPEKRMISSMCR